MLREAYPPVAVKIPMGDVFTSCNWVLRDGFVDLPYLVLNVVQLTPLEVHKRRV